MKTLLKKAFRKMYFSAFPHGVPSASKPAHNCVLGECSKIYEQAKIQNASSRAENIAIGRNTHIAGNLTVWANAGKIEVGDDCFVGENTRVYSAKHVKIGNRVLIAHGCNIFDSNIHSLNPEERHQEYLQNITNGLIKLYSMKEADVVIEDDVWIGGSVIILKGVTIGKGAIVGAGSVITTNIPQYAVAVGNPARIVREHADGKS